MKRRDRGGCVRCDELRLRAQVSGSAGLPPWTRGSLGYPTDPATAIRSHRAVRDILDKLRDTRPDRPVMDIGVSEYWAQLGGLMAKSLLVLALVLLLVLLETALG